MGLMKNMCVSGMVADAYNLSTQKAEAKGFQGQPGQHRRDLISNQIKERTRMKVADRLAERLFSGERVVMFPSCCLGSSLCPALP